MKNLNIVRRIDDLGRIAIPKDIRKIANIEENDAIKFFLDKDNNIILKKYNPEEE